MLAMKRLGPLSVALGLALLAPTAAWALDVPALEGRVNDHADLLPPAARQRIEQELAAYEASSGHQFALLTLPSLDGDALEPFSIRVVESWKLGKRARWTTGCCCWSSINPTPSGSRSATAWKRRSPTRSRRA